MCMSSGASTTSRVRPSRAPPARSARTTKLRKGRLRVVNAKKSERREHGITLKPQHHGHAGATQLALKQTYTDSSKALQNTRRTAFPSNSHGDTHGDCPSLLLLTLSCGPRSTCSLAHGPAVFSQPFLCLAPLAYVLLVLVVAVEGGAIGAMQRHGWVNNVITLQ